MSAVIVRGMKMPENCRECPFENYHSDIGQTVCMASLRVLATGFKTISFDGRHCSCPLIALPDKHGRLGDLDELIHELNNSRYFGAPYVDAGISIAIGKVCDASTIVEQEGE